MVTGPNRDAENKVSAFVRDETVSTWLFLRNGLIAAGILVGSLFIFAVAAIIIYRTTQ